MEVEGTACAARHRAFVPSITVATLEREDLNADREPPTVVARLPTRYEAGRAGGSGRNTWRSNASAARRTVASSAWRPTSIMPKASPSDMAQGTFMAGWPVTSNGAVFGIISRALAT